MEKHLALIVPAHNEERRIGRMLKAYFEFLAGKPKCHATIIVVLNGCTDNTNEVVQQFVRPDLMVMDLKEAGKGLAIKRGFEKALELPVDLIGFVDADMATSSDQFYQLLVHIADYDGIIKSRYMKGSKVIPPRPAIKEWGRRLVYQPLVWLLFGLRFADYQCGAKLFKRPVIEKVTLLLTVTQWAFDVELLYLCRRFGFRIREWPTIWYDQAGSKLTVKGWFRMLGSLFIIKWRHLW